MTRVRVRDLPPLPARARDAHKGDCGRVAIAGGSRGMAGAPCLAARAALRAGAGLVQVLVPETIWDVVAVKLDECTTLGLPALASGVIASGALEPLLAAAARADAVVLGPGLSRGEDLAQWVRGVVERLDRPLVLDADGLNAFAAEDGARWPARRGAPCVLTPHPGEMARLLGATAREVQRDRPAAVRACLARAPGAVVVLKGAATLVSDGDRLFENPTGNPGMATGGTGDVLAGVIAALIGQGIPAFDAACLGVYLHGAAGDLAAERLGVWSLTAGDLLAEIPRAFVGYARRGSPPRNRGTKSR